MESPLVVFLVLLISILVVTIDGFSSSPWASATWTLTLDVGGDGPIPTGYSSAFGGGGGGEEGPSSTIPRIVTNVQIQVTSANCPTSDRVVGPGASIVQPQTVGTYVTLQGQQQIRFSPGGWTIALREKPKSCRVQLWMDLECDIKKNDVVLAPAGERLYFMTQGWRETEYTMAVRAMRPIHQRYSIAQEILQQNLSHESGDRRLDGNDALETLQAYGTMAQLVLERDLTRAEYQRALEDYPPPNIKNLNGGKEELVLPEGPWPGSDEWLTLGHKEQNPIVVVAPGKGLFRAAGGELRVIGTWTAEPVLSEEDYDYVDGDDVEMIER